MAALPTALAAGSLALVPQADIRVAGGHGQPPGPTQTTSIQTKDCARELDPSFVHFVAPAPGSAASPILRLISSPNFTEGARLVNPARPMSSCFMTPLLTRNDDRP